MVSGPGEGDGGQRRLISLDVCTAGSHGVACCVRACRPPGSGDGGVNDEAFKVGHLHPCRLLQEKLLQCPGVPWTEWRCMTRGRKPGGPEHEAWGSGATAECSPAQTPAPRWHITCDCPKPSIYAPRPSAPRAVWSNTTLPPECTAPRWWSTATAVHLNARESLHSEKTRPCVRLWHRGTHCLVLQGQSKRGR